MSMSTRLQVIMDEQELADYRRQAARAGIPLSRWVREALHRAACRSPAALPERRIAALDRALACGHPSADIDDLLREIDDGRDLR